DAGTGLGAGELVVRARAVDDDGVPDPTSASVAVALAADTTTPDTTATPAGVSGTAVTLRGQATDDVGVREVRVSIRDTATGLWWTGSGWGAYTAHLAELTAPGTASTQWTLAWTAPG